MSNLLEIIAKFRDKPLSPDIKPATTVDLVCPPTPKKRRGRKRSKPRAEKRRKPRSRRKVKRVKRVQQGEPETGRSAEDAGKPPPTIKRVVTKRSLASNRRLERVAPDGTAQVASESVLAREEVTVSTTIGREPTEAELLESKITQSQSGIGLLLSTPEGRTLAKRVKTGVQRFNAITPVGWRTSCDMQAKFAAAWMDGTHGAVFCLLSWSEIIDTGVYIDPHQLGCVAMVKAVYKLVCPVHCQPERVAADPVHLTFEMYSPGSRKLTLRLFAGGTGVDTLVDVCDCNACTACALFFGEPKSVCRIVGSLKGGAPAITN